MNPAKTRTCEKCSSTYRRSKEHRSVILCQSCTKEYKTYTDYLKTLTIQRYHDLESVRGKHPSWRNMHIRALNRSWNRNLKKMGCFICGYVKHVELAHIKPISTFPTTVTLGEVNSPKNNLPLCRNHHWEFDHHKLTPEDYKKIAMLVTPA